MENSTGINLFKNETCFNAKFLLYHFHWESVHGLHDHIRLIKMSELKHLSNKKESKIIVLLRRCDTYENLGFDWAPWYLGLPQSSAQKQTQPKSELDKTR